MLKSCVERYPSTSKEDVRLLKSSECTGRQRLAVRVSAGLARGGSTGPGGGRAACTVGVGGSASSSWHAFSTLLCIATACGR